MLAIGYQQQWHGLQVIRAGADTVCFDLRAVPVIWLKEIGVGRSPRVRAVLPNELLLLTGELAPDW